MTNNCTKGQSAVSSNGQREGWAGSWAQLPLLSIRARTGLWLMCLQELRSSCPCPPRLLQRVQQQPLTPPQFRASKTFRVSISASSPPAGSLDKTSFPVPKVTCSQSLVTVFLPSWQALGALITGCAWQSLTALFSVIKKKLKNWISSLQTSFWHLDCNLRLGSPHTSGGSLSGARLSSPHQYASDGQIVVIL